MIKIFKSEWLKQRKNTSKKILDNSSWIVDFNSCITCWTEYSRKFFNILVGSRLFVHAYWIVIFI